MDTRRDKDAFNKRKLYEVMLMEEIPGQETELLKSCSCYVVEV